MNYGFISVIGLFIGILIAKYTKEELRNGEKWLELMQIIILVIIAITVIKVEFNIIGIILGIITAYFISKEFFYLGTIISLTIKEINFLASSLTLLYSILYGSIIYYKKKLDKIYLDIILFFIPIIFFYLNLNLISFAGGALIGIAFKKSKNVINLFKIRI